MKTEAIESGLPVLLVRPEDAAHMLGLGRTKVYDLTFITGAGSARP